jgi:hypothetical protein
MTTVNEAKAIHKQAATKLHEIEGLITAAEGRWRDDPLNPTYEAEMDTVYPILWDAQGEVARTSVNITWAYQDEASKVTV